MDEKLSITQSKYIPLGVAVTVEAAGRLNVYVAHQNAPFDAVAEALNVMD